VTDDPSAHALKVCGHLILALSRYESEARRDGFIVPPEVPGLRDFLHSLATARQVATPFALTVEPGEPDGMTQHPVMTKREAAAALRTSVRTVERLIASGALLSVKLGTATRIRRADLDAYVERLGTGPARPVIERKSPA